ncbi:MAG: phosphotransferase [Clostridia bacterium]|nr:phosphotransferase [Clostridia bacterium]
MEERVKKIVDNFDIEGVVVSAEPYGNGHINDTRVVKSDVLGKERLYILQKINKNVFKKPWELMENYVGVTEFIRKKVAAAGGDTEREVLNVIKAKDGKDYYLDSDGEYWRMLVFVTDNLSYDRVESPEQFYICAVAFGNFQYMLRDYPAETLHETIPNFHNTPDRFRQLMEAVNNDACGRLGEVGEEIEFAKAREEFAGTFERAFAEGKLPLRVTHNDTKLNNILFDAKTGKALCVVDLDTIMPGYAMNDFGDSIRFGATTAAEDEADLTKVNFDINLFELYAKGFIEGAKGGLTEAEIDLLPESAIMMTFECGMRFLADYLNGDTYFKIHRPKQNLDRARNQFKLVSDMEKALPEMHKIIDKYKEIANA